MAVSSMVELTSACNHTILCSCIIKLSRSQPLLQTYILLIIHGETLWIKKRQGVLEIERETERNRETERQRETERERERERERN